MFTLVKQKSATEKKTGDAEDKYFEKNPGSKYLKISRPN
jgi:hypothetical protein